MPTPVWPWSCPPMASVKRTLVGLIKVVPRNTDVSEFVPSQFEKISRNPVFELCLLVLSIARTTIVNCCVVITGAAKRIAWPLNFTAGSPLYTPGTTVGFPAGSAVALFPRPDWSAQVEPLEANPWSASSHNVKLVVTGDSPVAAQAVLLTISPTALEIRMNLWLVS